MQKAYKEVVKSPAFVVLSVFELVAEVGVANDFWMPVSPHIREAPTYQILTEGVPFLLHNKAFYIGPCTGLLVIDAPQSECTSAQQQPGKQHYLQLQHQEFQLNLPIWYLHTVMQHACTTPLCTSQHAGHIICCIM